jgi:nucleotide-binding universal stress UspA family protein
MPAKSIMVATDFSEFGAVALQHGIALAKRNDSRLIVAHAVSLAETEHELNRPSIDVLQECQKQHARVEIFLRAGPVVETLVKICKKEETDLLIVGSHGRTGMERMLLGSIAEQLVRESPCPVLVARPSESPGYYRNLLVPVDFSTRSDLAVPAALRFADANGSLELLHCRRDPAGTAIFVGATASTVKAMEEVKADNAATLEAKAREWIGEFDTGDHKINFLQFESEPIRGIEERMDARDFDLVVVASQGRKGVRRWVLGSVAELVVRRAPCSVLVLREDMQADALGIEEAADMADIS